MPLVSGINKERTAAINPRVPNTVFENPVQTVPSRPNMSGEIAPPTLAAEEQRPTAEPRTHVGYSSALELMITFLILRRFKITLIYG